MVGRNLKLPVPLLTLCCCWPISIAELYALIFFRKFFSGGVCPKKRCFKYSGTSLIGDLFLYPRLQHSEDIGLLSVLDWTFQPASVAQNMNYIDIRTPEVISCIFYNLYTRCYSCLRTGSVLYRIRCRTKRIIKRRSINMTVRITYRR